MESSRESNQCGASYSFMKKTSSHVYMLYFCIYTCLERNMLQLLNLYIYIYLNIMYTYSFLYNISCSG